jgi:hypothetical protein
LISREITRFWADPAAVLSSIQISFKIATLEASEVGVMALAAFVVFTLGIVLLGSRMLTDRRTKNF